MRELYTNTDIVIKPADKGGSIVIMNTIDYVAEPERQLNNPDQMILMRNYKKTQPKNSIPISIS